jgi:hypothetical protein
MGLLQNISVLSAEPIRNRGGAAVQCVIRSSYNRAEQNMNMFVSDAQMDPKGGVPNGYAPPFQFSMPVKDGGMSSYSDATGSGTVRFNLLKGLAFAADGSRKLAGAGDIQTPILRGEAWAHADLSGSGDFQATPNLKGIARFEASLAGAGGITNTSALVLLYFCIATLSGTGSLQDPPLSLIASMNAELDGQGSLDSGMKLLTSLRADLSGQGELSSALLSSFANLSSSLSGAGVIATPITLNLIAWCVSEIIGNGTLNESDLRGKLSMAAEITSQGDLLTAQAVASEVWNAVASRYDAAGSMGMKLNSAGAAANPWESEIEGSYTAADLLKIIAAVLAGKVSGAEGNDMVFRDLMDLVDRIKATVDEHGNRTEVEIDVS